MSLIGVIQAVLFQASMFHVCGDPSYTDEQLVILLVLGLQLLHKVLHT